MIATLIEIAIALLPFAVAGAVALLVFEVTSLALLRDPRIFWGFAIVSAILLCDIAVTGRLFLPDLLMFAPLVLGFFGMTSRRAVAPSFTPRHEVVIWQVFCIYMVIQAVRGLFFWDEIDKARWVIMWLILYFAPSAVTRFPKPDPRMIARYVLIGSAAYFTAYLLLFPFGEGAVRGRGFVLFVSTMFPTLFAVPVALSAISNREEARLGWYVLALTLAAGMLSDSRIAILTVLVLFTVARLDARQFTSVVITLGGAVVLFVVVTSLGYGERTQLTVEAFQDYAAGGRPDYGDMDRLYKLEAALRATNTDTDHFLFGYGLTTSGKVVANDIVAVFRLYLARFDIDTELNSDSNVALTGIGGWLVDTGWVGAAFVLVRLGTLTVSIATRGGKRRAYLLAVPGLMVIWPLSTSLMFNWLYWFAIMPNGIIDALLQPLVARQALAVPHVDHRPGRRLTQRLPSPLPVARSHE